MEVLFFRRVLLSDVFVLLNDMLWLLPAAGQHILLTLGFVWFTNSSFFWRVLSVGYLLGLIKNICRILTYSLETKFFTFVFPVFLYLAIFLCYCYGYNKRVAIYNVKYLFILLKGFVESDNFWLVFRAECCVSLVESIWCHIQVVPWFVWYTGWYVVWM